MAEISRRTFLVGTGTSAAAAGLFAAIPTLGGQAAGASERTASSRTAAPTASEARIGDPLVVHIPDPRGDEVHFMFGTREVVTKDKALVARLLRDAR